MNDTTRLKFGKRIRQAREDAGLSQLQVGVALGVSDKTISGYESDRISPPVEKLLSLADLFKKPIGFFLGDDPKDYTITSRLRAVEIVLKDLKLQLKEIKELSSQKAI
jgi:transcriptional regulator with XRE-family HTH domain